MSWKGILRSSTMGKVNKEKVEEIIKKTEKERKEK